MTTRRNSCLLVFVLCLLSFLTTGFAQSPGSVTVVPAIRTVTSGASYAVAFDAAGNMYIAGGSLVYIVPASTGLLSRFAGGGATAQDGVAPTATSMTPVDVKLDAAGNVYIADS